MTAFFLILECKMLEKTLSTDLGVHAKDYILEKFLTSCPGDYDFETVSDCQVCSLEVPPLPEFCSDVRRKLPDPVLADSENAKIPYSRVVTTVLEPYPALSPEQKLVSFLCSLIKLSYRKCFSRRLSVVVIIWL